MNELKKWIIETIRNNPGKYDRRDLAYLSLHSSCDTRETINALIVSKRLKENKWGYLKLNKSYASSNKKNPGSDK
jgi:hypothetical protein